jgi:hypothetical protein
MVEQHRCLILNLWSIVKATYIHRFTEWRTADALVELHMFWQKLHCIRCSKRAAATKAHVIASWSLHTAICVTVLFLSVMWHNLRLLKKAILMGKPLAVKRLNFLPYRIQSHWGNSGFKWIKKVKLPTTGAHCLHPNNNPGSFFLHHYSYIIISALVLSAWLHCKPGLYIYNVDMLCRYPLQGNFIPNPVLTRPCKMCVGNCVIASWRHPSRLL